MPRPEDNSGDLPLPPVPVLGMSLENILRSMRVRRALEQKRLAEMFARWGAFPGCYQIPCAVCDTPFYSSTPLAKYCSYRCQTQAYVARRKARREAARQKQCTRCGNDFTATQRHAKFCSNACRQASYREGVAKKCHNQEP